MRRTAPLTVLTLAALSLATFGLGSSASAGTLRVGATPVPAGELLEFVKPALAKQGVTLVVREFSDYVQPNLALGDGSLDANLFQHLPYLNAFQQGRPLNIVPVRKIYLPPLGLYSQRVKKVTELRRGATVAIPNDPSNGARALFRELEAAQLPRSLADVDAAIINTNYALEVGLNPTRDAIFRENENSVYVNILATTRDKARDPDVLKLAAALTSPEARAWLLKKYGGSVIPAF